MADPNTRGYWINFVAETDPQRAEAATQAGYTLLLAEQQAGDTEVVRIISEDTPNATLIADTARELYRFVVTINCSNEDSSDPGSHPDMNITPNLQDAQQNDALYGHLRRLVKHKPTNNKRAIDLHATQWEEKAGMVHSAALGIELEPVQAETTGPNEAPRDDILGVILHRYRSIEPDAVPSAAELRSLWGREKVDGFDSLNECLSVFRMPEKDEEITTIVSVDLCEVVRKTHDACSVLLGRSALEASNIHNYQESLDPSRTSVPEIVTALMKLGNVEPMPGIETMHAILKELRNQGVYVVANTSTLENCEQSTITFIRQFLPDAFDGILFPRNEHGTHPYSKAHAVQELIATQGFEKVSHITHIDDAPHHTRSFDDLFSEETGIMLDLLVPYYKGNEPENLPRTATRCGTEEDMNQWLSAYRTFQELANRHQVTIDA